MRENDKGFLSFILNILIPALILMKFSSPDYLGAVNGFAVAISFPLAYGLYELTFKKNMNMFSIIGFVNIFLTGGIGLLQLPVKWLAVKEAAIPFILGTVVLYSSLTHKPLLKWFLVKMICHDTVEKALKTKEQQVRYSAMLSRATVFFSCSFFLSAVLNFLLAKWVVVSKTGTEAFNNELGRMTMLSYPVIVIPSLLVMVGSIWYVLHNIKKITNLDMEQLLHSK